MAAAAAAVAVVVVVAVAVTRLVIYNNVITVFFKLVFPPTFFARGPLLASKNNHGSAHPLIIAHVIQSVRMIGIKKLIIYISEVILDSDEYILVA